MIELSSKVFHSHNRFFTFIEYNPANSGIYAFKIKEVGTGKIFHVTRAFFYDVTGIAI